MTSKRKCEDCGERIDICRELGGCAHSKPCRVCGDLCGAKYCDLCAAELDAERRVDAYIDARRGA